MRVLKSFFAKQAFVAALLCVCFAAQAQETMDNPGLVRPVIRVVAVENFYGNIARQIGGERVQVRTILNNPAGDPHLFEIKPSQARMFSQADIVIYNGLSYDDWVKPLLTQYLYGKGDTRGAAERTIIVSALIKKKPEDNPHVWYDTKIILMLAQQLARQFSKLDPAYQRAYQQRLNIFAQSLNSVNYKIDQVRQKYSGESVTATEPLAGYLVQAMGLKERNKGFQWAIMNETEPSVSQIADFEEDLKMRRVRLFLYNKQTTSLLANKMWRLAREYKIPVVMVSELAPAGKNYQTWMLDQISKIEMALAQPRATDIPANSQ